MHSFTVTDFESLPAVHQTLFNMREAMDKASKDHPKLRFLLQHVASVNKEKPNDKVDDKLPMAAITF